jgi:glucosamine--fructose-6-phosphate aminotransferase (isomerizing)
MCGIVGYVGPKEVVPVILEGLRRLEYRGYDSAGIAVGCPGEEKLELRRAPGKLKNIEQVLRDHPLHGTYGIGHTRWATHGRPTEENAHPHRDCTGRIVVVHNGIVENYLELKRELTAQGHIFVTETDTEIIAHLIEQIQKEHSVPKTEATELQSQADPIDQRCNPANVGAPGLDSETWVSTIPLEEAVRHAVKRLTGAFALGVLSSQEPNKIVAARFGPPAVLGIGEGEYFVASDVPGILHHTRNIAFLNDGEMAILTLDGVSLTDFDGNPLPLKIQRILWDPIQAEKGGYKHFMLKEIFEQPRAIRDTTLGRV